MCSTCQFDGVVLFCILCPLRLIVLTQCLPRRTGSLDPPHLAGAHPPPPPPPPLEMQCSESPQWRRGPSDKPILCNACGTRYRRTNQLGCAVPSSRVGGKRGSPTAVAAAQHQQQACGRSAAAQQPPLKQHRVAVVA